MLASVEVYCLWLGFFVYNMIICKENDIMQRKKHTQLCRFRQIFDI
jgi:hypothetical protein